MQRAYDQRCDDGAKRVPERETDRCHGEGNASALRRKVAQRNNHCGRRNDRRARGLQASADKRHAKGV
ncbi:hypothetical protein D3C85_1746530 [compost metagenome]